MATVGPGEQAARDAVAAIDALIDEQARAILAAAEVPKTRPAQGSNVPGP